MVVAGGADYVLLSNAACLLSLDASHGGGVLGLIEDPAVLLKDGQVVALGPSKAVIPEQIPADWRVLDCRRGLLMPGLADCHTHMVFAGRRSWEWRRRLAGERYEDILAAGGGIHNSVRATRQASEHELGALLDERLDRALVRGITTLEVKSGYGLSHEHELRLLGVVQAAAGRRKQQIISTYLGAHAVPGDHAGGRSGYVDEICERSLPEVAERGLASFVDVYCDRGAYSLVESERILRRAKELGLGLRIHAEQIEYTGGAGMAARLGAASADHLERIDSEGIQAMANSGCAAVLLPAARFYLRDRVPPARELADAGVPIAVSTDYNPGTSPTGDLLWNALMACQDMGLRVEEAILGITRIPRQILGLTSGVVREGAPADLILFDAPDPAELLQWHSEHSCVGIVLGDRVLGFNGRPLTLDMVAPSS